MLQIKSIHKQYKTGSLIQKALDGVSLNLRDNEFVAILGPSGSGKTTLLNIIGGLDRYDSGDLIINGISTKKYKDRDWDSYRNHTIGFVFQSYNLIPHQTVLSNVELALTISGISGSERKERARHALEQVGLGNQLHKRPSQMSGGQMQRVAIARALVNDPDILLADEPTGALDSETSVQVMELLKEVAKDRLVVMVTHNPELAEQYATRIVNLKDGHILSDTDPCEIVEEEQAPAVHKNMGKTSMSFLTALSLSFNNLRTKKARTLLTSFAGSIGIIGIALILALSTGVNSYIHSVEEETLSEYPLEIMSTGLDMSALISDSGPVSEKEKKEGDVHVSQMITSMFSTMDSNDLASLKAYLDGPGHVLDDYTNAIEYTYSVTPQIYRINEDNSYRQVHPDTSFSSVGLGAGASANSFMSMSMSTNVFYEMPSDKDLYESSYDVKAGRWPKDYTECVLVLTGHGNISDFLLYTLGLRDSAELDKMVSQFAKEENITTPGDFGAYDYDDILGKTFKLVNSPDCYVYDQEYHVWKDKTEDQAYMTDLLEKSEDLTIVGIVQPSEDASASMLNAGICYPASLTQHVIDEASKSEIVRSQLASSDTDVFTGVPFGEEEKGQDFQMDSLFTVDTAALQNAFQFDESAITSAASSLDMNLDLGGQMPDLSGSIDLTGIALDIPEPPALSAEDIIGQVHVDVDQEKLKPFMNELMEDFSKFTLQHGYLDPAKIDEYFLEFIQQPEVQEKLKEKVPEIVDTAELEAQVSAALEGYLKDYTETAMTSYSTAMTTALETQISKTMETAMQQVSGSIAQSMQKAMGQITAALPKAFSVDGDAFANAIQMNMNSEELSELMMSLMAKESASLEGNLKKLGYADIKKPSSISIYPKDFSSKEEVLKVLDDYNADKEASGEEEKVITYTDMVGTMMSSVTSIIDTISYVLVAFVAISLVVSSIMIGVITYISVLERKKEIGILRAIGASKKNISQVFNAETFIVGLCAGLIGIGLTLLLLIPGNYLIRTISGHTDIRAYLAVSHAVILVALSVVLTLIGGLLPSKKAAKSDPVTALRTE